MDNVCDTWAERYAELLITRKVRIASSWNVECTILRPSGPSCRYPALNSYKSASEAFSPGLLQAMNKGTRAKQNLLVQKWLKELGIESLSNLISHHPKATLQHVKETKQILRLIPHFERLNFSELALLLGTPLDKLLGAEDRRALQERQVFDLPKSLDRYFVFKGEYEPPAEWFGKGVSGAWDRLVEWEECFSRSRRESAFMLSTNYGSERILVRDGRSGKVKDHHLIGDAARIYDLCHQGPTMATLVRDTGLPAITIEKALSELISRKLLVELEGGYIALAVRPRDELIHNCVGLEVPDRSRSQAQPENRLPLGPDTQISALS